MDERTRIFFWALGGAAFFAAVGAIFGGLAGAMARSRGKAVGGLLGAVVTRAVRRVAEHELSPRAAGALTGAVDGAFFLAIVGSLVGIIAAHQGREALVVLLLVGGAIVLLASGAILFGSLAYLLVETGPRAVGGMFFGAMLGAIAGRGFSRDGLFYGLIAGVLVGAFGAVLSKRLFPDETEEQATDTDPAPGGEETYSDP